MTSINGWDDKTNPQVYVEGELIGELDIISFLPSSPCDQLGAGQS